MNAVAWAETTSGVRGDFARFDVVEIAVEMPGGVTSRPVKQAFRDWSVLVFRDQQLDRESHKAFGRHFGTLHSHPMNYSLGGDAEMLSIRTTADSAYTAGDGWHTDVTCDPIPPLASALYITETPECGGGDTLYADMYLAYELLSDAMKDFLEPLTAVHDGALPYVGAYKSTPPEGGYPRNEHPVIAEDLDDGVFDEERNDAVDVPRRDAIAVGREQVADRLAILDAPQGFSFAHGDSGLSG